MYFFHKVEDDCNFCDMQLSDGYIKQSMIVETPKGHNSKSCFIQKSSDNCGKPDKYSYVPNTGLSLMFLVCIQV